MSMSEESKENLKAFIAEIIKQEFVEVIRQVIREETLEKDLRSESRRFREGYDKYRDTSDLYRKLIFNS